MAGSDASRWAWAERRWERFSKRIHVGRLRIRSSLSTPWYRGHSDVGWSLTPGLFRLSGKRETGLRRVQPASDSAAWMSDSPESLIAAQLGGPPSQLDSKPQQALKRAEQVFDGFGISSWFRKPAGLLIRDDIEHRCSFTTVKLRPSDEARLAGLWYYNFVGLARVVSSLTDDAAIQIVARELARLYRPGRRVHAGAALLALRWIDRDDLGKLNADARALADAERFLVEIGQAREAMPAASPQDPRRLELQQMAGDAETDMKAARARLLGRFLVPGGERDAFAAYAFRTGAADRTSWVTLGEMQHVGIPTRLLDWTESLPTAVYFAIRDDYLPLTEAWFDYQLGLRRSARLSLDGVSHLSLPYPDFSDQHFADWLLERHDDQIKPHTLRRFLPSRRLGSEFRLELPQPCIWMLNPYELSNRRSHSGKRRIWSLTENPRDDYFVAMLADRCWDHEGAIPSYSPWSNERIAAQRGMFTVHGHCRLSLEEQCDFRPTPGRLSASHVPILYRAVLQHDAAIHASFNLVRLMGLDEYSVYRDLDRLGAKIRNEFLSGH